jgi:prepilin-type N-terminal cleavage/methylation domain-containing protein
VRHAARCEVEFSVAQIARCQRKPKSSKNLRKTNQSGLGIAFFMYRRSHTGAFSNGVQVRLERLLREKIMPWSNRRGFTLIELLIVVVIIGVLAAIAVPKFQNTKGKANAASLRADLRNLGTAEEAFFYVKSS